MAAKKISFAKALSFEEITSITVLVHNNFPKNDINLYFKVS